MIPVETAMKWAGLGTVMMLSVGLAASSLPARSAKADTYKPHVSAQQGPKVLHAEFGQLLRSPQGMPMLRASRTIPLTPGTTFGWVVCLEDYKNKDVSYTEEFILPTAPKVWGGITSSTKLSADRRTATTTLSARADSEGCFTHAWTTTAGDPSGFHQIKVTVEDKEVASFDFDVR